MEDKCARTLILPSKLNQLAGAFNSFIKNLKHNVCQLLLNKDIGSYSVSNFKTLLKLFTDEKKKMTNTTILKY